MANFPVHWLRAPHKIPKISKYPLILRPPDLHRQPLFPQFPLHPLPQLRIISQLINPANPSSKHCINEHHCSKTLPSINSHACSPRPSPQNAPLTPPLSKIASYIASTPCLVSRTMARVWKTCETLCFPLSALRTPRTPHPPSPFPLQATPPSPAEHYASSFPPLPVLSFPPLTVLSLPPLPALFLPPLPALSLPPLPALSIPPLDPALSLPPLPVLSLPPLPALFLPPLPALSLPHSLPSPSSNSPPYPTSNPLSHPLSPKSPRAPSIPTGVTGRSGGSVTSPLPPTLFSPSTSISSSESVTLLSNPTVNVSKDSKVVSSMECPLSISNTSPPTSENPSAICN